MFEQYENKEFPCPSRESKKRIGEPGHDSDSSWDSFCRAYCGPGAARLVKLYPRDLDLIDEAIQKTLIRIRKEQGLHYDRGRFHLSTIFLRRLKGEMSDLTRDRRNILRRDADYMANDAVLRQPGRTDAGTLFQNLTDDTAAEINRELVSGTYKRRSYADRFDNRDVLIWKYLLQGLKGTDIISRIGGDCSHAKVSRVKKDFPVRIVRLARERIRQHGGLPG